MRARSRAAPRLRRALAAVVAVGATAAGAAMVTSCASPACTETATCPEGDDGSATADQFVEEPPAVREAAADVTRPEAEAGDASESLDASADVSDATMGETDAPADRTVSDSSPDGAGPMETGPTADSEPPMDAARAAESGAPPDAAMEAAPPPPTCPSGYACVASPPSGWFGPGVLSDAPTGSTASCVAPYPNGSPYSLQSSPNGAADSCECACGSPSVTCSGPTTTVYSDNTCVNACGTTSAAACTNTVGCSHGQSARVAGSVSVSSASCPASAVVTATPPITWSRTGNVCSASTAFSSTGCSTGSVCANTPPSSFLPYLCVWRTGTYDCSTVPGYGLQYTYYQSASDGRGCGLNTCGCSTSAISCSLSGVTAYGDGGCTGVSVSLVTDGGCNYNLQNEIPNGVVAVAANAQSSGSCTTTGTPSPTGSVSPNTSSQVTVCCTTP